jgi:hypothetical protein
MMSYAARLGFLASCAAFLFTAGAAGQTTGTDQNQALRPPDVQQVLSWLPSDTETVVVDSEPWFPEKSRELPIGLTLSAMALTPLWFKEGALREYVKNQRAVLALAGSRHFRAPRSLGLMPFEGCTIVVLADNPGDRADLFFNSSAGDAVRVEEVEGQKILVFEEKRESDLWTTFVTLKRPNVLLAATNLDYLREVLARMRGNGDPRALPEILPEWRYVNTGVRFWGLRHYDRSQGDRDPTSPFWDPKKFIKTAFNDEQAIGLTFSYDPANRTGPIITYLSGNPSLAKKALAMPFEGSPVSVVFRELDAGAIEASYGPGRSTDFMLGLVLPFLLGHGIFL